MAVYNVAFGSLGFVAMSVLHNDWQWLAQTPPPWHAWIILLFLGTISAGFVPTYYVMLRRMPVWKLRTWMLAVPMLVAVADWLLWGTRLSGWQWLGAGLLLGGLAALIQFERSDQPICLATPEQPLVEDSI